MKVLCYSLFEMLTFLDFFYLHITVKLCHLTHVHIFNRKKHHCLNWHLEDCIVDSLKKNLFTLQVIVHGAEEGSH